jgi:DNA-binding transcriptional regulator YiaG
MQPMESIDNACTIYALYSEMYSWKSNPVFHLDMNIVHLYIKDMKHWTPEEIKEFRKRLGLYQKDFAPMIGVTERYVIYLERGLRKPSQTLKILLSMIEKAQGKEKENG